MTNTDPIAIVRQIEIDCLEHSEVKSFVQSVADGQFEKAIGYLSTWGLSSLTYRRVRIWLKPKDQEIVAHYFDASGTVRFVMVGIWREDEREFTFHS